MRLTNKLFAQHLGWTFKKHWQIQGKRIPRESGAAEELMKHGITIKDPKELFTPKRHTENIEIFGHKPKDVVEDESHPLWKSKVCYSYGDKNVLVEGLPQALLLTNTVEVKQFPKNVDNMFKTMKIPKNIDKTLQNIIMAAHILDAEQVKLPKEKVPERPAYNLPRSFGVSHERKNRLLINKLINECDKLAGKSIALNKKQCDNAKFKVTIHREQDVFQFNGSADVLLTSKRPIEPILVKYDHVPIPDLYPLKSTISIPKKYVYSTENVYPLSAHLNYSHPHTIFSIFDREQTRNLHGSMVTDSQFQSRTLLKAFGLAAARAQQLYGKSTATKLPKPLVVQSVQTDGRTFHFGVFQLNTLSLDNSDGPKNVWFHYSNLELFENCFYKSGRPVLLGLNTDVFKYFCSFYNNM